MYQQNPEEYYALLYHNLKYESTPLPDMNPLEKMEYSIYSLSLATEDDFPFNAIVMTEEWYKVCYEYIGKAFFEINNLKVYIDRTTIFPYAFLHIS